MNWEEGSSHGAEHQSLQGLLFEQSTAEIPLLTRGLVLGIDLLGGSV